MCVTCSYFIDYSIMILQPSTHEGTSLPSFDLRVNLTEVNTNTIGFGYGFSSRLFRVARFFCSLSYLFTIIFTVVRATGGK